MCGGGLKQVCVCVFMCVYVMGGGGVHAPWVQPVHV